MPTCRGAIEEIPALQMLALPPAMIEDRAHHFVELIAEVSMTPRD